MHVIATVRLAPGQVGFYDDLTRIHLTIQNPEKHVLSGHNTTNLKTAVRSKRLLLLNGSLDASETVAPAAVPAPVKAPEPAPVAPVAETVVTETVTIPVKDIAKQEAPAEAVTSDKVGGEAVTAEKLGEPEADAPAAEADAEPAAEAPAEEPKPKTRKK